MKRAISISRETYVYVVIMIVIVVSAMIREINLLIVLSALMFGPLLVSWQVLRMTLAKLHCKRQIPQGVYPGELINGHLRVTNQRKRLDSWALVVHDRFVRQKTISGQSSKREMVIEANAFIPNLRAASTEITSYRGKLWERGRYHVGPLKISTRVPLGLLKGTITIPNSTDHVLVYPRLGTISNQWKELVKVGEMGPKSSRQQQGHMEGDFYGLRGWRSGDSQRWIHWRSTAKRNELVVRQFEQSRNQNFVMLLDLFSDHEEAVEKAISFVATLVVDHCRRNNGHLVLGVAGKQATLIKGSASNALVHEALEILAEARAPESDTLPDLAEEGMASVTSDDRLILISAGNIDVDDTNRFSKVWNDRRKRRALSKAIKIDVGEPMFETYFSYDQNQSKTSTAPVQAESHGNNETSEVVG